MTTTTSHATGPKTDAGKAISARNATTHGLFCRQTVLPHLGEDPAGFQKLLDTLHEQLRPRNLMETQYLELWADASWKLRRLSRLEAQVWEDNLDEDARLAKLERLIRLQTSLRRQLDKAVRMLSQDVPNLFAHRTREDVMAKLHLTETQCAENPCRKQDVERAIQDNRHWPPPADDFTDGLDNTPPADGDSQNCQNEPAPTSPSAPPDPPASGGPREVRDEQSREVGSPPTPPDLGTEAPSSPLSTKEAPLSRRAQRRRELQQLEDLLNSGTLTKDEQRNLLMNGNVLEFSAGNGRIEIYK